MNQKKLRIAMLGHKRIPSREGGIEIVVEELSCRMAAYGHRVTCYNRGGHHVSGADFDTARMREYKGVRLCYLPTIDKKGLAALTSSLFGAIRAAFGRYDVVHFHAEGPCAMMWIPKLFGKRCVCTIHGLDWQRAKWGNWASRYILFGEKTAVRLADEMIVLSHGVQKYFQETYHRDTRFIPNGVTRPVIRPAKEIQQRFGLEKDSYLLFLGRLVPEKGLTYLIEAYKQLKTDKKLVIAGGASDSGGFIDQLYRMAEGNERILFTGFVQGEILDELYSNAYLYLLPSDVEGMPLTLLEAMSYGNCCLTSDIAECAEVVEDKGLTFQKGNIADLKAKMELLCGDHKLVEDYKAQSAEFVCKKYNWDEVTRQTLALYIK